MRLGIWAVAALMLGSLLAHFLLQDKGYVLINFHGYVIEMSVPALIVVLAGLYFALRLAVAVWRSPRLLGMAVAERRMRRAGDALTRALIQMTEGNWARGEKLLTRSLKRSDAPLVNYLMAARAAQQRGSTERRNEWLKLAYEELPDAEAAVLLTQAELQYENGEYEPALATLNRLGEAHPDQPVALALLAKTYRALGDRDKLRALLPKLHIAHLSSEERESLVIDALRRIDERADFDMQELQTLWSSLSPDLRHAPRIMSWRARALDRLGAGDDAEAELRAALKREWNEALVRVYGEIASSNPRRQLRQAENWLKSRPEDGVLLLTAARLCLSNELWGKARSYLESSLALAPEPASYALYGRLLTQLGETASAASAYRSGLGMVGDVDFALPALEAPADGGRGAE
jgi:HemY protein